MKVKAVYRKHSSGDIEATITVTDKEDYITDCIFNNPTDWPSLNSYNLKSSVCNYILKFNTTSEDALVWTREVINELSKRLIKWREVKTPLQTTFNI